MSSAAIFARSRSSSDRRYSNNSNVIFRRGSLSSAYSVPKHFVGQCTAKCAISRLGFASAVSKNRANEERRPVKPADHERAQSLPRGSRPPPQAHRQLARSRYPRELGGRRPEAPGQASEILTLSPAGARPSGMNKLVLGCAGCEQKSQPGRYQIIAVSGSKDPGVPTLIKLDTGTGTAWSFHSELVENPHFKKALRTEGWEEIPESFKSNLVFIANINPDEPH